MKKTIMIVLAATGMLVAAQLSWAAAEATKTITGQGACAKCVTKEAQQCQMTVTAEADGKKTTYHLVANEVTKDIGKKFCASSQAVTVTGTVHTADGKQLLTPTKIQLAKD